MATLIGPEVPPEWHAAFDGTRWGVLTDGRGWNYYFRTADARWLVPALYGESSRQDDRTAISWAMGNRLYLLRDKPFIDGREFADFPTTYYGALRSYSQPVNPYWLLHGAEEVRAHRAWIQSAPPSSFPGEIIDLVVAFMTGQLNPQPRLSNVIHFADCNCSPGCGRDAHGPEKFAIGGQCYWASTAWPRGIALSVVPAPTLQPRHRGGSVLLPFALGGIACAVGLAVLGRK